MILKYDHSKEPHFVTDQFIKPQQFFSHLLLDNDMIIHNYKLLTGQQGLRKE